MKRFRDILVVAGPDEERTRAVLAEASELARRNDAVLTLFGVVESVPPRRRFVPGRSGRLDVEVLLAESRLEELQEVANEVSDLPVRVGVANGTAFLEIIKRVEAFGHDLVVTAPDVGGRSRGLTGASTTMHLLRKCPVPVWVSSPGSEERRDVAVAVKPSEEGYDDLNRTLFELGSSLAERRGGILHIVSAWRLEGESIFRTGRTSASPAHLETMLSDAQREAEEGLNLLVDAVPLGDAPNEVHLVKGEPAEAIVAAVENLRPGVLVMGTLARAGIPGVIMGNTAERVLGTVDASILAVKPPGFQSPVAV